ncbi:MAG: MipA/OmpV family protein [Deltaproteobacteria bacterium]|nr:MipA/OmpV family protein [Deltaproteobacteria bacterium]
MTRKKLKRAFYWTLLFGVLLFPANGHTSEDSASFTETDNRLPLWEYGIAGVAASLPHYIGSDEYKNYVYPLPYVIYRGEILRADREGIRGIFYKGEKFETSISLWGNPPVSDENEARQGMPELDAIGEIGPAFRYYFYRHGWEDHLYLQAAWRTAFSFGFNGGLDIDMDYQGWHSSVDLSYHKKTLIGDRKLSIYVKGGLHFADSRYNKYFYGVPSQYADSHREPYEADGGYAGFSVSGSLFREMTPKLSIGCYIRWNNLDGAVFEDSALVKEKNNYAVGALVVWKLIESSKPAP